MVTAARGITREQSYPCVAEAAKGIRLAAEADPNLSFGHGERSRLQLLLAGADTTALTC